MNKQELQSDQLSTWSDKNAKRAHCRIAKTPQSPPAKTAPAQSSPSRLPHRTFQTLRQAGVQMRRRPRPWPQVLSFGELSRLAAANGLCASGGVRPDGGTPRQLPSSSRDLREDLRDQPRTAAPPGGALRGPHERCTFCPAHTNRCGIGRRAPRQYAPSLARWRPNSFVNRGGRR